MKHIFFKIFALVLLLYSKFIYSIEIDIKKDLTLLKKNDQYFFLRNCEKSKVILETDECLNFLGIKLFLVGYRNKNISDSELEILYSKAINYLEIASKNGSKQALKNLGWIFSNKELSFFDLEKSSIYFNNYRKNEIYKKSNVDKNNKKNKSIKNKNYSDIVLAITLIKKLEIYFEATKNKKKKYLTETQLNKMKNQFDKVLHKKKIDKNLLADLENKVLETNSIIFSFLKEDIKIYNKENFDQANKDTQKLIFLLKD